MSAAWQSQKAWYLVYTKVHQEYLAQENLQRQNFTVFLPQLRQTRRRQRSLVKVVEPMFPRYLFLYLDSVLDNWSPIRSTTGVAKMVRFGDMPIPMPQDLIDTLKRREAADGWVDIPDREFAPGEKVRLADGPMAGYEAIFAAKDGNDRVTVLLNIVGQQTPVKMPLSFVEAM